MTKNKASIDLPVEAFALLIRSAAQAIINELDKPALKVSPKFLHECIENLDELISKFEVLHNKDLS